MSLRYKVLLILTAVVLVYAVGDNLIQRVLVSRSFEELEVEEAQKDLDRALAGIEAQVVELDEMCRRLASWSETRRFVEHGDQRALDACLALAGLESGDLDLFFLCDPQGVVLHGASLDPLTRESLSLRDFPHDRIGPGNSMLREVSGGSVAHARSGLFDTRGHGLMVVSAQRVRPSAALAESSGSGSSGEPSGTPIPSGTLIMGRFLGPELVREISERMHVDFSLFPLDETQLPERERLLKDQITSAFETVYTAGPEGQLFVYGTLNDVHDNPVEIVRANIERSITERGYRAVLSALLSSIATAILILLVMLRVLGVLVIAPLSELTQHAVAISRTDDTSTRIDMQRTDEIGVLSKEFDSMMDQLAVSRQQLAETARLAGMSDVATGVLHNVGNVLNSVNVSTNILNTKLNALAVEDLDQMLRVIEEHQGSLADFLAQDPRGEHLLPFLREVRDALSEQKRTLAGELDSLTASIGHVIELVRSQQGLAGGPGIIEPLLLSVQLDAALNITTQSFPANDELEVVREFGLLSQVTTDRRKLLEILVNLIQNARQALDEDPGAHKRVVLRTYQDGQRAIIEVEDNGPGIKTEELARIFGHGFTTKKDGHGFGLHISANAATEMGGRLFARSAGPGRGATFVLELPLEERVLAA